VLRSLVFPDFESGFRAVVALYSEGVRPTMVDYGDELWTDGPSENAEATLYLAFDGFRENVAALDLKAKQICYSFGGRDGDQEEVEHFWATRHDSGESYRREVLESPDPGKARRRSSAYRMDYLHVALPVTQVLAYRSKCQQILASHRVVVREWSLWARPEFLSFVIMEEDDRGDETSMSMAETVDQVLALAQEMGGTMEYCHGVGLKLAHLVEAEMGSGITLAKRMKQALDPHNILNPGKLSG
jgi:glycolate oxidase